MRLVLLVWRVDVFKLNTKLQTHIHYFIGKYGVSLVSNSGDRVSLVYDSTFYWRLNDIGI